MVLGLMVSPAFAVPVIPGGGFEGGNLPSGYTPAGNVAVVPLIGNGDILPFSGSSFLGMSTGGGFAPGGDGPPPPASPLLAGTGPFPFFVGDPAGTGAPIALYSGFSFDVTLASPMMLGFWANVFTDEIGGVPDVIGIYVDSGSGFTLLGGYTIGGSPTNPAFLELLGSDFTGGAIFDPAFGFFANGQTGWRLDPGPLPAGTHTIAILVGGVDAFPETTGIAIDDISLTAIPEPGSWLLFGIGAVGLVGWRRRGKKAKQTA